MNKNKLICPVCSKELFIKIYNIKKVKYMRVYCSNCNYIDNYSLHKSNLEVKK